MKAPKEIYISCYMSALLKKEGGLSLPIRVIGQDNDIKYLSEESVNEILQEKGLQEIELNHIKTLLDSCEKALEERNKMLAEKDKEIERLKEEIASLELKLREKYKQGYSDGVKDWENEHLNNNKK